MSILNTAMASLRDVDYTTHLPFELGLALVLERVVGQRWSKSVDTVEVVEKIPKTARVADGSETAAAYAKRLLRRDRFAKAMRKETSTMRARLVEMEPQVVEFLERSRRKGYGVDGPSGARVDINLAPPPATVVAPSNIGTVRQREILREAIVQTLRDLRQDSLVGSPFVPSRAIDFSVDTQFRVLLARTFDNMIREEAARMKAGAAAGEDTGHVLPPSKRLSRLRVAFEGAEGDDVADD